jgi:hypothetical protein
VEDDGLIRQANLMGEPDRLIDAPLFRLSNVF